MIILNITYNENFILMMTLVSYQEARKYPKLNLAKDGRQQGEGSVIALLALGPVVRLIWFKSSSLKHITYGTTEKSFNPSKSQFPHL